MSRAKQNPDFVWHVTAGFGLVQAIENFWHNVLKWNAKGYAAIIELDGTIWWLHRNSQGQTTGYSKEFNEKCFEFVTNGVQGFNNQIVNCATIGGVENVGTAKNPIWKGKDTRTDEQKASQLVVLDKYFQWLKNNGGDVSKISIDGHYHYSTDKNRNGIIEPWERIKECPCYDAKEEFRWLLVTSENKANQLPKKR
jgi:N-acetylmuramoyl-L-alanine amidase